MPLHCVLHPFSTTAPCIARHIKPAICCRRFSTNFRSLCRHNPLTSPNQLLSALIMTSWFGGATNVNRDANETINHIPNDQHANHRLHPHHPYARPERVTNIGADAVNDVNSSESSISSTDSPRQGEHQILNGINLRGNNFDIIGGARIDHHPRIVPPGQLPHAPPLTIAIETTQPAQPRSPTCRWIPPQQGGSTIASSPVSTRDPNQDRLAVPAGYRHRVSSKAQSHINLLPTYGPSATNVALPQQQQQQPAPQKANMSQFQMIGTTVTSPASTTTSSNGTFATEDVEMTDVITDADSPPPPAYQSYRPDPPPRELSSHASSPDLTKDFSTAQRRPPKRHNTLPEPAAYSSTGTLLSKDMGPSPQSPSVSAASDLVPFPPPAIPGLQKAFTSPYDGKYVVLWLDRAANREYYAKTAPGMVDMVEKMPDTKWIGYILKSYPDKSEVGSMISRIYYPLLTIQYFTVIRIPSKSRCYRIH